MIYFDKVNLLLSTQCRMKKKDEIGVYFQRSRMNEQEWKEHCRRFGKDPVTGRKLVMHALKAVLDHVNLFLFMFCTSFMLLSHKIELLKSFFSLYNSISLVFCC